MQMAQALHIVREVKNNPFDPDLTIAERSRAAEAHEIVAAAMIDKLDGDHAVKPVHKPTDIKGYTTLSPEQIAAMNEVKDMGAGVGALIENLSVSGLDIEPRWAAIAKTALQKGFMFLTRAIAKPEHF